MRYVPISKSMSMSFLVIFSSLLKSAFFTSLMSSFKAASSSTSPSSMAFHIASSISLIYSRSPLSTLPFLSKSPLLYCLVVPSSAFMYLNSYKRSNAPLNNATSSLVTPRPSLFMFASCMFFGVIRLMGPAPIRLL